MQVEVSAGHPKLAYYCIFKGTDLSLMAESLTGNHQKVWAVHNF